MHKVILKNWLVIALCALLGGCLLYTALAQNESAAQEVRYEEFWSLAQAGKIDSCRITAQNIFFTANGASCKTENPGSPTLTERLLLLGVQVEAGQSFSMQNGGSALLAMAMIAGCAVYVGRRAKGEASAASFEKSGGCAGFSAVAGHDEVIESLTDIVEYLKDSRAFDEMGARMPRGILLYGPPGTGKTLTARALAAEAGVPFLSANGSDFVQMYVGVGAKRIRSLFAKARECKKCVVFIDEIDAIGKKRSDGSDSERDQTLNELLTQMSGFTPGGAVVVLAATNRIDTLDSALLRPGRFDRQLEIGMPDAAARESILRVVTRDKPLEENIDLGGLARQTVGFSGAALESMVNEAAITAVREKSPLLREEHLERAYGIVLAGEDRKHASQSQRDRQICAYHEAGHAIASMLLLPDEQIKRVSIIPSTRGAAGYVLRQGRDGMATKERIENYIVVAYAGRAAEQIFFGKEHISQGASNDIEKATEMIELMCARFAMAPELGVLCYDRRDAGVTSVCRSVSARLYTRAMELLYDHSEWIEALAGALLEKESLTGQDVHTIVESADTMGEQLRFCL